MQREVRRRRAIISHLYAAINTAFVELVVGGLFTVLLGE